MPDQKRNTALSLSKGGMLTTRVIGRTSITLSCAESAASAVEAAWSPN